MALPLILVVCILVAAGILFFFGRSSDAFGQKGAFIAFAAVLLIITGTLLMSEGLELPIQETITKDGDTHTVGYQTLVNTEGTAAWVLFNTIFWSGAVLLLLSLVYTITSSKDRRFQDKYAEYEI